MILTTLNIPYIIYKIINHFFNLPILLQFLLSPKFIGIYLIIISIILLITIKSNRDKLIKAHIHLLSIILIPFPYILCLCILKIIKTNNLNIQIKNKDIFNYFLFFILINVLISIGFRDNLLNPILYQLVNIPIIYIGYLILYVKTKINQDTPKQKSITGLMKENRCLIISH